MPQDRFAGDPLAMIAASPGRSADGAIERTSTPRPRACGLPPLILGLERVTDGALAKRTSHPDGAVANPANSADRATRADGQHVARMQGWLRFCATHIRGDVVKLLTAFLLGLLMPALCCYEFGSMVP